MKGSKHLYFHKQYFSSRLIVPGCCSCLASSSLNQFTVKFFSMSHFKPMDPLDMPVGFQALNFTQVPLQSSCADLRLKPHPLVNKLSIVTPLSQRFPIVIKAQNPSQGYCQKFHHNLSPSAPSIIAHCNHLTV